MIYNYDIKLVLPIYAAVSKKKTNQLIGMNWYRNAYYHEKHAVKEHYHALVAKQLLGYSGPVIREFDSEFVLYWKSPISDPDNIISAMQKFALDGLKNCGILTGDSVKFHMGGAWINAGQDKEDPRVECFVRSFCG